MAMLSMYSLLGDSSAVEAWLSRVFVVAVPMSMHFTVAKGVCRQPGYVQLGVNLDEMLKHL